MPSIGGQWCGKGFKNVFSADTESVFKYAPRLSLGEKSSRASSPQLWGTEGPVFPRRTLVDDRLFSLPPVSEQGGLWSWETIFLNPPFFFSFSFKNPELIGAALPLPFRVAEMALALRHVWQSVTLVHAGRLYFYLWDYPGRNFPLARVTVGVQLAIRG